MFLLILLRLLDFELHYCALEDLVDELVELCPVCVPFELQSHEITLLNLK